MTKIKGLLFDKDGTLFDFDATWSAWSVEALTTLAGQDHALAARLGDVVGFDLGSRQFQPGSVIIAGTPTEIAQALSEQLRGRTVAEVQQFLDESSATARQYPTVPLVPLLEGLRARGLRLGVATNDSDGPARAHLEMAGIADFFDFIVGSDAGHGGKPAPGQLHAFADACGLCPSDCAMIGDSAHDLSAGRAAGMTCVAVLTGPAPAKALAPLADVVLPDIGHLPGWLDSLR